MALPFSFSNNTSPTGVQLDADLAALGAMGTQLCVATGTNTITLAPGANQPTVAAYVNQQLFVFTAVNSSSGPVTARVNALAFLPLYLPGGAQADTGNIVNGSPYLVQYLAALNSGSGGFLILSALPASGTAATVVSSAKGLTVNNNSGVPSTKVDITAGYTVLATTGGTPKFLASVSVTIDLTTTGANGMDTGARPTSNWVYLYIINNGSATAGLATATSPISGLPSPFPGGYANYMYVGAMYCDGSQNLLRSKQKGRISQYTITAATNTSTMPLLGEGVAGTYSLTAPTYAVASTTAAVPPTAGKINIVAQNKYNNATQSSIIVAPNTSYSGIGSTNPPPMGIDISAATTIGTQIGWLTLESVNVAWAASATGGGIWCSGWDDYWVNA